MNNLTFFRNLIDLQLRRDGALCQEVFGHQLGHHIWMTHFHQNAFQFKFHKFDLKAQKTLVNYIHKNPTI